MLTLKLDNLFCTLMAYAFISTNIIAADSSKVYDISVNNLVEECLQVIPLQAEERNNVVLFDTELKLEKGVGYCGCNSKLLSYFVDTSLEDGREQIEEHGVFSPDDVTHTFVIDRHIAVHKTGAYTLNIQCAGPE